MIDQSITREYEVGIGQMYFLAEQRLLGVRHILPAHGDKGVERVLDDAARVVIRYASCPVVVQTVGRQHGGVLLFAPVHQTNMPAHTRDLGIAVIVQLIAEAL